MKVLLRRVLPWISSIQERIILRSCSSTTRQEFGRAFEEIVVQSLRKFSLDVAVCGGPRDRGIDFRGIWRLKSSSVRVIGQCKRYKRRLGPRHVRELEGSMTHEVKETLGIIVSESGYSKDAYEVSMGSLYPIALTTLSGHSDDILHWYSSQGNNKQGVGKFFNGIESDSSFELHCKSSSKPLLMDSYMHVGYDLYSNTARIHNNNSSVNNNHQYDLENDKEINNSHWIASHEHGKLDNKDESSISPKSCGYSSFRTGTSDKISQVSSFRDADEDSTQLTNSQISEMGIGVFTMFELNPAAQKLLPNLVVGMKYRRHNSKTLELFINEDDSFVIVTK